jgi:hypothetical protein
MAQLINEAQRFQKLAGIIKESQLNEEVINFGDKDQFSDFLQNKTKQLENSKIKLKINNTFANEDPEKQKYTGDIAVNIGKRTGGTGNLTYDATLVDAGGYKYLAPAKGKKISITIPSTTGGQGGFDCEDPELRGIFKVESLEFLSAPAAQPQKESFDIESAVNEALTKFRKLNENKIPFFHLKQVLTPFGIDKPKADQMADLKVGLIVLPKMAYKDTSDVKAQVGKITKIEGDNVTVKKPNGKEENRKVSDLIHLIDGGFNFS